jgi:hypothetical protein
VSRVSARPSDVALTRERVREAVERAGDEHWRALIEHHEDAYPASRPTPGDICRAEAERLNALGLGGDPNLDLIESRVQRHDSTIRLTHVFQNRSTGKRQETEPFENYG